MIGRGFMPKNTPSVEEQNRVKAGIYLEEQRQLSGVTQKEIAEAVGYEFYSIISQLEGGHTDLPKAMWVDYAKVLGVDPSLFAKTLLEAYSSDAHSLANSEAVSPDAQSHKITDKSQHPDKKIIEIFWAFLGGLLFSMLPRMLRSADSDAPYFHIYEWLELDIARVFYEPQEAKTWEFGFGFIITLLLIWSRRKYKTL